MTARRRVPPWRHTAQFLSSSARPFGKMGGNFAAMSVSQGASARSHLTTFHPMPKKRASLCSHIAMGCRGCTPARVVRSAPGEMMRLTCTQQIYWIQCPSPASGVMTWPAATPHQSSMMLRVRLHSRDLRASKTALLPPWRPLRSSPIVLELAVGPASGSGGRLLVSENQVKAKRRKAWQGSRALRHRLRCYPSKLMSRWRVRNAAVGGRAAARLVDSRAGEEGGVG
mmetsp:Transcript_14627/g.25847  ORF Transcript_14627/g.25847 Transcript_14627/m.25847 type:complete len:227 (-) Transcript_14627:17-697(-)